MSLHDRPITVALLGTPAVSAATIYGFFDALHSTRRDWEMLHGRADTASPFRPLVVSADGRPFEAGNGVRVTPDASFADCPHPDVAVVTDLMIAPGTPLDGLYDAEVAWMRGAYDAGATLASACSGALLLARTGLLDGHDATSHWAYCDLLAREYPRTRWHAERGLVVAGTGQRIIMAGSGVAWHMLVLSLIARFASPEDAMQVARINLLDLNGTSALAYASLTRGPRAADELVARCQLWAASNYRAESPVAQMVALSGLPERTFKRRFTQATGMTPLEYVHTLRLEEAKQMLESTELPVEAVAGEVGYQDTSFFGRLFRRKVALTPAQYRKRFGALGAQLRQAARAG
ncbi:GlxA family transcriptional regulator [Piscinibacter sp.]|uniref:GlxA family transcriptional regulator n=1 Tax=Piscinibacter sp. TaxID=1903157 RepID=UPI002CFF00D4|nr:helix-turn-helix domain-containing protein [Albitalea sp.]HUG25950.1 helix-turn-helix domain-containing protein [Albitalea sp.]